MIARFIAWPSRRKYLFFYGLGLSFYVRLLDYFPTKRVRPMLISGEVEIPVLCDITWAIRTVSKHVPWNNVCRHQALMAMNFCKHYGQALEVYVGFKKNTETGKMEGHTWTIANGKFITGHCNVAEYTLQNANR